MIKIGVSVSMRMPRHAYEFMAGIIEYVSVFVRSDRRKIVTWGGGSDVEVIGRIVRHRGWEQVPLTSIPSGSSSDFLGTRRPQLSSWIRRMCASVVSIMEINASGWWFIFTETMEMLSCIVKGTWVLLWMPCPLPPAGRVV